MSLWKRVFENGAIEHRRDAERLGADAYSEDNVPEGLKDVSWVVRDVEADPLPESPAPPPTLEERLTALEDRVRTLERG